MSLRYYFINERVAYTGNRLAGSPRIVKFSPIDFLSKGVPVPFPSYETVKKLIKSDVRYKEFKGKKGKTAKLIALEEHIQIIGDTIIQSNKDDIRIGNLLRHIAEGTLKNNEFSGIHYLPTPLPDYIINYKEVEPA